MADDHLTDPQFAETIRRRSSSRRSDVVYDAIRQAIASGIIRPGEWMRQDALAQELDVSQVTVREALSRLVAEGLAVDVPYKGVKAVLLPEEELTEVYDLRTRLEGLAIEHAAGHISATDLARMRELLPDTVAGEDPDSVERARRANREFHLIPVRASERRHLIRFVEQLMDLANPYPLLGERTPKERMDIAAGELDDHTGILEALERSDGRQARRVLGDHLQKALRLLTSLLREHAVPSDLGQRCGTEE